MQKKQENFQTSCKEEESVVKVSPQSFAEFQFISRVSEKGGTSEHRFEGERNPKEEIENLKNHDIFQDFNPLEYRNPRKEILEPETAQVSDSLYQAQEGKSVNQESLQQNPESCSSDPVISQSFDPDPNSSANKKLSPSSIALKDSIRGMSDKSPKKEICHIINNHIDLELDSELERQVENLYQIVINKVINLPGDNPASSDKNPTKGLYSGECEWDEVYLPHGFGVFFYSDSQNIYIGHWRKGKQHGEGTLKMTNGDQFNGYWIEGKRHGEGTLKMNNGDQFISYWIEGKRNGKETLKMANGEQLVGYWQNDQFIEPGELSFVDGRYLRGFRGRGSIMDL